MTPVLTRDQAVEIQEALIYAYSKPEFQAKLAGAFDDAEGDRSKQIKARQDLCLPIQCPIIRKYGFEPSRKGVALIVVAFVEKLNTDPQIKANNEILAELVNPRQGPSQGGVDPRRDADVSLKAGSDPKVIDAPPRERPASIVVAVPLPRPGRHWRVVGGGAGGGIVVRRGKALTSQPLRARLESGSEVREIELSPLQSNPRHFRLHYEKLHGDGPEFGWVNVSHKHAKLLEPVTPEA